MNYIFINIFELDEDFKIANRAISEAMTLKELCISINKLEYIAKIISNKKENILKSIVNKISVKKYERKFKKILLSLRLSENNCFILSNNINLSTDIKIYIKDFLESLDFKQYKYEGEYKLNAPKHVTQYVKNNKLELINTKCIIIYKKLDKIDSEFLNSLLENHKIVNIYSELDIDKYISKRLFEFNQKEGTTVSVIKGTKKSLKEYDVAIYVDSSKENFRRLRLNKNILKIDLTDIEEDIFDDNYIKVNNMLQDNKLIGSVIERLYSNYGKNKVASIITKIM